MRFDHFKIIFHKGKGWGSVLARIVTLGVGAGAQPPFSDNVKGKIFP